MKNGTDKKIFISYRVQDSSGETGRLVDVLKQYFSDDQLFMDIENLEPGMDFTEGIEKSLSSCDVFLAVIGPAWAGERPGKASRLNDADDWVRTEVGSALRRNIRVVPVLVDGGSLPKAEDLPEDLQPLLKRQAIEISNKRWRYDTDQLVNFLVKTVGVPPKKAVMQRAAAAPKKNKTWLYVGGGFVLAIVLLVLIASLAPDEEQKISSQSQNNAAGLVSNNSTTQQPANSDEEQPVSTPDISGSWDEISNGDPTIFVFTQNGSQLGVQVQISGQLVGSGSGTIHNHVVEMNVPMLGIVTTMNATLSEDGNSLDGNLFVQAAGTSEPLKLVRRNR